MNVEYRYSSKECAIPDAKYWLVTGTDYSLNDLVGSYPNGYCDKWMWYEMVHDGVRTYPHIPRAIAYCTERSANCVKTKDWILSVKEISRNEMIKILKEFPDNEIPLDAILV
jgi:hypothetical protein